MTQIHCYPTLKQKITIPSRTQLVKKMKPLGESLVNLIIPTEEIIERVGRYLSEQLRVNVYHSLSYKCPPETIIPSAEYFPELDSKRSTPIHITLISHPNNNTFLWDHSQCNHVLELLADTIIHEMVHMRNVRKRKFWQCSDHEYNDEMLILSDFDCIDAYAHNIADDIEHADEPWILIRQPSRVTLEQSISLWNYMTIFGHTTDHPTVRRLLKKVHKLLEQRKIKVDIPVNIAVF
jgi:hypothetical protein